VPPVIGDQIGPDDGLGDPSALLTITIRRTACAAIVRLVGEWDMETAQQVAPGLDTALDSELPAVVVDLTDLEFLGSVGISALVGLRDRATDRGVRLHLVGDHPVVVRPFQLTGMDGQFSWHPTLMAALDAVEGGG
jgi:anti-sigma B factor antagonist